MDFQNESTPSFNFENQSDFNDKFDLFDEFNSDMEKNSNEVLRLTHSKIRDADKKVASMDKILDDIRKKFEYEQKNLLPTSTTSAEFMLLVNDKLIHENDPKLNQTDEKNDNTN